jgi:hypothetical protein
VPAGAAAVLTGSKFDNLGALADEPHDDAGAPIAIFAGDLFRDDERQVLTKLVSELFPAEIRLCGYWRFPRINRTNGRKPRW